MSMPDPAIARAHLALANRARLTRIPQRKALCQAHPRDVLEALLDPSPELGSYRLGQLFCVRGESLIPGFAELKLERLFHRLNRRAGYERWHDGIRLRDTDLEERRLLVEELIAIAPAAWKARLH